MNSKIVSKRTSVFISLVAALTLVAAHADETVPSIVAGVKTAVGAEIKGGCHGHMKMDQEAASREAAVRSEALYNLPDTPLLGMDGAATSLHHELASEKVVFLNFIFTTCTTICPVLSASFQQLQQDLNEDIEGVKMVSISIDPEYDRPGILKTYAEKFSSTGQWHFYTGETQDIIDLQKAFKAYRGAKTNHELLTFVKSANSDKWTRIEGVASSEEMVALYNKLKSS